jgi:hypothetical protein
MNYNGIDNRNRSFSLIRLIFISSIMVLATSPVSAVDMHIVFSVNGDTTAVSAVQGDTIGWGADCTVGGITYWQIWYDLNGNSTIDDPGDKLVNKYTITDGDTSSNGPPPDNNPVPDGWYMTSPMLLGIAPGTYVFRVDDMAAKLSATKAIIVTALPTPPNTFNGQLVVPGHPAPDSVMLRYHWIEANDDTTGQMWSAFTTDSGKFTINVGSAGTGVTFEIYAPAIAGYVAPASQWVQASGHKTLPNFAYTLATDSVYGTVTDDNGLTLQVIPSVYATPQAGGNGKDAQAVNGDYTIYFTPAEWGVWWVGVSSESILPGYMARYAEAINVSSNHGIEHNFVCPKADTTVYVRVTENGAPSSHQYRIQITQNPTGYYTETISGTGGGNLVPARVANQWDTGWYAMIVTWDSAYPIPPNLVLDGTSNHSFGLGDTITLNFISGKMVRDTIKVDPGDLIPNWDSVWVGLCNIDDCSKAAIDPAGVFTVYADTGDFSLTAYCTGYLTYPYPRGLHLTGDTSGGLGFVLNQTHCRVSGTLNNVPLPLSSSAWVFANTSGGTRYAAAAQVDWATGTYELLLCDGLWTIDPPTFADRVTPSSVILTIGENPDSVRAQDFTYSFISDVGDQDRNLPKTFALKQNYPNPFNPATEISFDLPHRCRVELAVYNVLGQKIMTLEEGEVDAGTYTVTWNGKDARGLAVSSGVYFYRFATEEYTEVKKMLMIK